MSEPCTVIVMAKAPVAGFAKTRLIPALGEADAAALARRLLQHAVEQAVQAGLGAVDLCCTPGTLHPAFEHLRTTLRVSLTAQGEGDLGARMQRAFERTLDARPGGVARALLMGTDAPALDAAVLRRAATALDAADAVFVPAHDGGYALIGLRQPSAALFEGMAWSTPTVMARTRERLAAAGLRHTELPALTDIDEPADLVHVPAEWLR